MPAQMRTMVKQQITQLQQVTDPAKLEQALARMQQMAGQVPPAMKPAMEYLQKKMQERLDELRAAPPASESKPEQNAPKGGE
jgi:hypothetical protein